MQVAGQAMLGVGLAAVGRRVAEEAAADLGEVDVGLAVGAALVPVRARVAPAQLDVLDFVDVFGDLLDLLDEVGDAVAVFDPVAVGQLGRVPALGDPVDAEMRRAGGRLGRLGNRVGVAIGVRVVGGPGQPAPGMPIGRPPRRPRAAGRRPRPRPRSPRSISVSPSFPGQSTDRPGALRATGRRYFKGEPRKPPVRVALAQINPTVGDIDANAAKVSEWIGRARGRGGRPRRLPGALRGGLPGRGPLPEAPFHRGQPARRRGDRGRRRGHRRPGRLRRAGGRRRRLPPRPQLPRRARRRRGALRLPQDPPAQLRGLRRAALLHPRHRGGNRGRRRDAGRASPSARTAGSRARPPRPRLPKGRR